MIVMVARAKRATYADIEALPRYVVGEILFGVLHVNPRPGLPHANVATTLGAELHGPFQRGRGGPGGWVILDEPELHLGTEPDVVVPDIAGWRQARMPQIPAEPFTTVAPDWVCEIPFGVDGGLRPWRKDDNLRAREGLSRLAPRPKHPDARGLPARRSVLANDQDVARRRRCERRAVRRARARPRGPLGAPSTQSLTSQCSSRRRNCRRFREDARGKRSDDVGARSETWEYARRT